MEIKRYSGGDEKNILDLFGKSFGKPMSIDFWKWRYQSNPFVKEPMIHLMWDEGQLVGHYAVSPVEMKVEGQHVLAALSMTTMTHPEYAGRGIFTALAESLYTEIKSKGVDLVWGFPNANSHYGFVKNLQWTDIGTIPFLSKKIADSNVSAIANYNMLTTFSQQMAAALSTARHSVSISKSTEFLNWRYSSNPQFKYQILSLANSSDNFVVFKVFRSFSDPDKVDIDIMELNYSNDVNRLNELVTSIAHHVKQTNNSVHQLNIWCPLQTSRHIQLERQGFSLAAPITFLSGRSLSEKVHAMSDFRNWDFGMGYSDVF